MLVLKIIALKCIYDCRLCDLVGFGVGVATGKQFVDNFPERTYKSMLLPLMMEDKRAGRTMSYATRLLLNSLTS